MTKDLSLGYVTGGSITRGSNLSLNTSTSAGSGTITARTSASNWSETDSSDNLQYANGTGGTYDSHSYYSFGAAQKVCPKGWRPPTFDEYVNVVSSMGDKFTGYSKIRNAPYNFIDGGAFYPGKGFLNIGVGGLYWQANASSSANAYYLYFMSDLGLGVSSVRKSFGMSVRCVAAP